MKMERNLWWILFTCSYNKAWNIFLVSKVFFNRASVIKVLLVFYGLYEKKANML